MIALDTNLLKNFEKIFIQKSNIAITDNIKRLLKYIQLPIVVSSHQNEKYSNAQYIKQLRGYIKIVDKANDTQLINSTKYKLMLTTNRSSSNMINIKNDNLKHILSASCSNSTQKIKAKEHIKSLIQDAKEINIYDKYLSKINDDGRDIWNITNLQILKDILPQKENITINIYCKYDWDGKDREDDLDTFYPDWTINKFDWDNNMHDRYIIVDKLSILLSSGFEHLSQTSSKDFTYIIEDI